MLYFVETLSVTGMWYSICSKKNYAAAYDFATKHATDWHKPLSLYRISYYGTGATIRLSL